MSTPKKSGRKVIQNQMERRKEALLLKKRVTL